MRNNSITNLSVKTKAFWKKNISGWLLMLPSIIFFGFFIWEPIFSSIRISLYSAQGVNLIDFVGFSNYVKVFNHPDFLPALKNTFSYTFWSLIIGFLVPIILAIFINEIRRGKGLFKVGIYLPNIVPGMAMVLMFSFIFKPGPNGILNILLSKLGLPPSAWLTNPALTKPLIIVALTWKGAGSTALLYIAGLQGIDPELYEAAIIDGAGIWKRIRYITLPCIYNLARTLLILQIISVFQILYEPLVMTNGGPNNASISIMQLMYRFAFEKYDYPKASAVAVIICIILSILTVAYNKLNKKKDF